MSKKGSGNMCTTLCQNEPQQSHKSAKRLTTFEKKVVSRLGFPWLYCKPFFHKIHKVLM